MSSNADAEVNYLAGAVQTKTLLWSCANINALTRVGVEAFYTFNATQGCFLERQIIWKSGDCTQRATAPSTPVLSASVHTINPPAMVFIGGGTYALYLDAEVTNTGNVTIFSPVLRVSSLPSHFSNSQNIGYLITGCPPSVPPFACTNKITIIFNPSLSTSTASGQQYTFTLTVEDSIGNPVGSTSFNLTAP